MDSGSRLSEPEVLSVLLECREYVSLQMKGVVKKQDVIGKGIGPAAILSLAESGGEQTTSTGSIPDLAYGIVTHPAVFITPEILYSYVALQSLIRDPAPIPAVFTLYANKPFTPAGSSRVVQPNRKQAKYAVPEKAASAALDAAVDAKDISVCLDIIDTSYSAPAFRRAKLIRRATPVGILGCLMPPLAYVTADAIAKYQDEVDHALAVQFAFGGLLTYVGCVGAMGLLATLTANDQMVRVTWAIGTPLRERWMREEERAALDKVAQAWGFEDPLKRGFEEGEEWELLREVVMRKGMLLDNSTLMTGME